MSKTIQLMLLLACSLSVASVTAAGKENKGDSNLESSIEKSSDKEQGNQFSDEKRHYGKHKIYSGKESSKPKPNADPGT